MKAKQISKRGYLFTFDSKNSNFEVETSIYIIIGDKKVFVIDTHCGADSMMYVHDFINHKCKDHEIVVVNTHYDWDHVFGNMAFSKHTIISHQETYDMLDQHWESMEIANKDSCDGDTSKCLPNKTFVGDLDFLDEGVRLFHSPGHTHDSISVYDNQDKVLFVADNLEKPLPYLQDHRLQLYVNTLNYYHTLNFETLVCTHSGVVDFETIEFTKGYLNSIIHDKPLDLTTEQLEVHGVNRLELKKRK
ncbi:MAG: MBL fold metallo-hydrolase [Candidatus Cloacimonetes bacterium]|nr:MBL fold metallo-hydrolase [Candidatus Cloacimonadota bacterium]